jgi:hypothetical protein
MANAIPAQLVTMRAITGTIESPGDGDNPTILGWAAEIGRRFPELAAYCANYTHDAIAWCGLTVGYCMAMAGIRPVFGASDTERFLYAMAWKNFGSPVDVADAQPGDVLVFNHHVTLCDGIDGDYVLGRGGNQRDQVKVSRYAKSALLAVRRPPAPGLAPIPAAPLRSSARRLTNITATMFADATVAYRDIKPGWNDRPGVALPASFGLPRPRVRVWKDGRSVDCDIVDKGPWNTTDAYWTTGARPQAESGADLKGRATNRAGIDLTPAADHAIGLNGKGLVDWEFINEEPSMTDTTTPAPVVVTVPPAQSTNDKIRSWVHTAFAGILTAIVGWQGINLPATINSAAAPKADQTTVSNIVQSVFDPQNAAARLKDPQVKAQFDAAMYQIVSSGVPGQLLQSGLGLIPGASPFVSVVEPIARKAVADFLAQQQQKNSQVPQKK